MIDPFQESVKSSSKVDARANLSGKANVQQSNLANTNDLVSFDSCYYGSS